MAVACWRRPSCSVYSSVHFFATSFKIKYFQDLLHWTAHDPTPGSGVAAFEVQDCAGGAWETLLKSTWIYSHPTLTGTQRIADAMQDIFGDIHALEDVLTTEESPWNTQTDRFVGRAMGQAGQKPSSSAS